MVIRVPYAGGIGGVEHHCDSSEAYYAHTPGLHVVAPATAAGRVRAAARGDRLRRPGRVPGAEEALLVQGGGRARRAPAPGIGRAVRRAAPGTDATLIAYGPSVPVALEAAAVAAQEGRSLQVVDLRSIVPFDDETVCAAVRSTGRAVVVAEAPGFASVSSEIVARVTERCFHSLAAPIRRVTGFDIPYPPPKLEHFQLPGVDRILDAVDDLQWERVDERAADFLLPDLGEGLTEAEIVQLAGRRGRRVAVDQPVVEVETAKSMVEVPSPVRRPGRRRCTAPPGETRRGQAADHGGAARRLDGPWPAETYREEEQAGSGNVLIGYGTRTASGGAPAPSRRGVRAARPPRGPGRRRVPPAAPAPSGRACRWWSRRWCAGWPGTTGSTCTPSTAPAAAERSPAATWSGASPAAPTRPPLPCPGCRGSPPLPARRRRPASAVRRSTGSARPSPRRCRRSRAEIPEATVWVDVDATALWDLRESSRTATDAGPGLLAYLARFVVAGLQQYPVLNSRLDTERQEIVELDAINLGIAVQGERGLVVPAVLGARDDDHRPSSTPRSAGSPRPRARAGRPPRS